MDTAPADAPCLDLHEGIDTPGGPIDPAAGGCQRWPERLRLLNHETGELLPGRCKATNLCPYCARLFAVETSEMLLLDAMEDAPTLYVVLTAREYLDHTTLRRHLAKLRKYLRQRWPDCRWAVMREYQRRGALHVNLLVKGVAVDDRDAFYEALSGLWCSRVDASPLRQYVGEVATEIGLVKYVTLHFMKESQAPGIGWRGHRYSATRDYLVRPAAVMREEARRSLRLKRKLWRGMSLEVAQHELAAQEGIEWSLRHVNPSTIELRPERTSAAAESRADSDGTALPDSGVNARTAADRGEGERGAEGPRRVRGPAAPRVLHGAARGGERDGVPESATVASACRSG